MSKNMYIQSDAPQTMTAVMFMGMMMYMRRSGSRMRLFM